MRAMDMKTFPYLKAVAHCHDLPFSVFQSIEPEGLKKGLAHQVIQAMVDKITGKVSIDEDD